MKNNKKGRGKLTLTKQTLKRITIKTGVKAGCTMPETHAGCWPY
jgi:hypothetical protein